jgi:archaellum component FlaF (FlaF/FlaG flagellin family)
MHLSLKGSMDRQPLTDRLGDRLLAEYGGAAAAYSLRALNGNGDSVVRVRRASDNDEEDFTAEQIELGEMVNWVNSQTVPPLDIGVETSEGRIPVPEGGTSIGIPAAAYSLRNLSTTYTGNVVDVRRSSDDAEDSFTAAEVSDGTLEAWVNTDLGITFETAEPTTSGATVTNASSTGFTYSSSATILKGARIPFSQSIPAGAEISITLTVSDNVGSMTPSVRLASDNAGQLESSATPNTFTSNANGTQTFVGTTTSTTTSLAFFDNVVGSFNVSNVTINYIRYNGHVTKWYDQSGNDNHATQGTAAKQPKIVDGGSLVTGGIDFDGVDDLLRNSNNLGTTSNFFISCVATLPDSITNQTMLSNGTGVIGSGDSWFLKRRSGLDNALAFQDSSARALGSSAISETQGIFAAESNGTNLKIYANGSEQDSVSAYTLILNGTTIGARHDEVSLLTGQINEIIIYDSDQSDNRTAIEANIGETYGITGIPAYDNTVDGFVETWYDQSGNGNDATQSVAASQPKIVDGGSLVTGGINFDGVNDALESLFNLAATQPITFFTVATQQVASSYLSINGGTSNLSLITSAGGNVALNGGTPLISTGVVNGVEKLVSSVADGVSSEIFIDGSSDTVGGAGLGPTGSAGRLKIGNIYGLNRFADAEINEVIIYDSDQSANRSGIETNINAHYDIYP